MDRWKQTKSLGDGMKFGAAGRASQYEQMMDQVVLADNKDNDSAPEAGLVVCKDDGETLRFQGDSRQGSMEAVTADGRVVALSAWTEGLELKFAADGQSYIYRGLDEKSGRYGQDVAHQGYWKVDDRGIYIPDNSAPTSDW